MNKTWKWILGIAAVSVLVGAMFTIGFMWQAHRVGGLPISFDREWNGPMMERGDNGWTNKPRMWERNDGWSHPMMYERGFSSYHPGFFMLGGLVKLALFFGLLYGAYWLGRRNARIALDPVAGAPVAEVIAPEAEPASPSPEAESAPAPRKRGKKVSDQ